MDSFVTKTASDEVNDSVIRVEVMDTSFIAQLKLSFLIAYYLAPITARCFHTLR